MLDLKKNIAETTACNIFWIKDNKVYIFGVNPFTNVGANYNIKINLNLKQVRQAAEKAAITHALVLCDSNISSAAKILGITRPTLYDLLKKHMINDS